MRLLGAAVSASGDGSVAAVVLKAGAVMERTVLEFSASLRLDIAPRLPGFDD